MPRSPEKQTVRQPEFHKRQLNSDWLEIRFVITRSVAEPDESVFGMAAHSRTVKFLLASAMGLARWHREHLLEHLLAMLLARVEAAERPAR